MPWVEDGSGTYWDDIDSDLEEVSIWDQDKSGEFEINKRFDPFLNPDNSDNQWVRNAYEPRWDTPAARKFLEENAAGLEKRKAFIASEADKGNIQPYLEHQQALKRKGLFPKDVEPVYNRAMTWLKQKGLDESLGGGLAEHDVYSHAYPEKFFGPVDSTETGLTTPTAVEEGRASMFDMTHEGGFKKYDWDSGDIKPFYKYVEKYGTPAGSITDVEEEARYYSDKYLSEVDELAKTSDNPLYRNNYGTPKQALYDPLVGKPYTDEFTDISEAFREGARSRFPEMNADIAKKISDESIIPYSRDLQVARKLQLTPEMDLRIDYKGIPAKDIWTNTYFAASPDMAAAKLLSENWRGGVVGAGASLLNPEVAKRAKEGDYLGATNEFGKDVGIGALTEAGLKGAGQFAQRVAPSFATKAAPFVGGTMNVVGPGIVGAGLFSQGQDDSLTDLAAKATIGKVNPYSGTANAQDWEQIGRAQQAREKGGKWKLGGMTIPETGISEYMGIN